MSCELLKNKEFIKNLNKYKKSPVLKKLIKNCSSTQIKAICELCFNVLRGNIDICKSRKKKLTRHADLLRFLADKHIPLYKKKTKLLSGNGLFLSTLLPLAMSVISGLVSGR